MPKYKALSLRNPIYFKFRLIAITLLTPKLGLANAFYIKLSFYYEEGVTVNSKAFDL